MTSRCQGVFPGETGDFRFCPVLSELVAKRQIAGRTGKVFEGLSALSSSNNLIVLRNLCRELRPDRTIEIGMSFGGSCLVFTASHRDLGHRPEHQHLALDPYQATVWDDCGMLLTERAGLSGWLDFRPRFSALELPALIREGLTFQIVYIDGSHLFEDVFVDQYFVGRLLTDGGIVIFDDSSDPNVAKVLRFIRRDFKDSYREMNLGPFRSDGGRSFKYSVARLFNRIR